MPSTSPTDLLQTLRARFAQNMRRHPSLDWTAVQAKLEAKPEKLQSLQEMEATGGEPDVIGLNLATEYKQAM